MRTVKLFAASLGEEREFSPEHALNILLAMDKNKIPGNIGWVLTDPKWVYQGGVLKVKKIGNGTKSDTGVGDEAPELQCNSEGDNPQP